MSFSSLVGSLNSAFGLLGVPALVLSLCSLQPARAQEIAQVSIFEGQTFVQTSAAAPVPTPTNPFVFRSSALAGSKSTISSGPTIQPPGGAAHPMTTTADITNPYYRFNDSATTLADLSKAYPTGAYTIAYSGQFSGAHSVPVNFPAGVIPAAPQISNFAEAQSIDPKSSFNLRWAPFANGTSSDGIQVNVSDASGNPIISSPAPDVGSGALTGTAASFTIPAGTLKAGQTYTATVTFYKVTGHVLMAIPLTFTAYVAETKLTLVGAGAAPVDTTPPKLVQAQPPDGFVVPVANYFSFPVSFEFSEQMTATESIQWSSNIDPGKVHYEWVANQGTPSAALLATYDGGWPAGAHITWILNPVTNAPSNFRDAAGNQLATNTYKGGFLTGAGSSGSVCAGSDPVLGAGFGVVKTGHYYQNSAGQTVLDTNQLARFRAFYDPPTAADPTLITLQIAALHKLDSLDPSANPTNFVRAFTQTYASLADLDAAYPAGGYEIQQRDPQAQVTGSALLNLSAGAYPPIPHFQNLPIAAGTDLNADLTVRWDAFTNQANAGLSVLEVYDQNTNLIFRLPDACNGRDLPAGSTSAVIPGGTFDPSSDYFLVLSFYQFSDLGKTLPGIAGQGFASLSQSTTVSLKPKNDVVQQAPPDLNHFLGAGVASGQLQLQFSAWASSNYVLEATSDLTPPTRWVAVQTAQSKSQLLQVSDPVWQQFPHRFYRIRLVQGDLPSLQTNGTAVVDTSRTTTQTIDDDGGDLTLTSVLGDVYTLHIDPYSMIGVEDVSMSLVNGFTSLPFSDGFVGGVQFAPADLPFLFNATLTVQFASPPPSSLAAAGYHQSDGIYFLEPISIQGNTVTIPVDQLGGIALGQMNAADLSYFKTNSLSFPPDIALQTTALFQANASLTASAQTRRLHTSTTPPTPAQQFQSAFDSTVYPQLLAVQDGLDTDAILAALNGYIIWYDHANSAGLLSALAADVENANNVAKVTINNRVVYYLNAAEQHDIDAIIRLSHLRKAITHAPWGATWVPGDGQTLLDRINKMLHMTVTLDSRVHWDTAVGPVTSKVHGQVEYQPDGLKGTIKGVGQITWVDHEHYQPSPCIVTPSLTPGTFTAFALGVYVQRPATHGGRYVLKDWRFKYWPDGVDENDNVICPFGSSGPILEYWFPTFGHFREKELIGVTLQNAHPQPAFAADKSWTVSQTGNPVLGQRDYSNEGEFQKGTATEDSTFLIQHTPQ